MSKCGVDMKKILVSACLLGTPCRYDGKSKPCDAVIALSQYFELIPVCPEVMGGLQTPRVPAERTGDKVITENGKDVTKEYLLGAQNALRTAKENGCRIAVLKEKSPSCGKGRIYDGTHTKTLTEGNGTTAELLLKNGITVIGESEIHRLLPESAAIDESDEQKA